MSLFTKVSASCLALVAFAPIAAAQPAPTDVAAPVEPPADANIGVGSHITVIGAINDPASAEMPAPPEDKNVPELPVVYEDDGQG